uniref:Uncharacterized protein n=1 Tax=Oryza nivara TaxID=4536 RepID=A0A0E0I1U9_ORYNI
MRRLRPPRSLRLGSVSPPPPSAGPTHRCPVPPPPYSSLGSFSAVSTRSGPPRIVAHLAVPYLHRKNTVGSLGGLLCAGLLRVISSLVPPLPSPPFSTPPPPSSPRLPFRPSSALATLHPGPGEKQEKSIHRALALSVANQLTNIFRDREKCQYNGFRKLCSMISFEQLSPL